MHCIYCAALLEENAKFCTSCGSPVHVNQQQEAVDEMSATRLRNEQINNEDNRSENSIAKHMKSSFSHATEKINPLVGEQGDVDLNLKALFSNVFKKHTKEEAELKAAAEDIKKQIEAEGFEVVLTAKSGEDGRLFGSITTKQIAEELNKQHKIKVDRRKMELANPIRSLGYTNVPVKLYPDVNAKLRVHVKAQ